MTRALRMKESGALYRFVDELSGVRQGHVLRCYDVLLRSSRGRMRFNRMVEILFDPTRCEVVEVPDDLVRSQEERRRREKVCRRFHPDKCPPDPFERKPEPQIQAVSVVSDEAWVHRETVRLLGQALEALTYPGRYNHTQMTSLKFDLGNLIGLVSKRAPQRGNVDGMGGDTDMGRRMANVEREGGNGPGAQAGGPSTVH